MIIENIISTNSFLGTNLLYHYTSLSTCIENILGKKLFKFSPVEKMNDPKESDFTIVLHNKIFKYDNINVDLLYEYFQRRTKIACFTIDNPKSYKTTDEQNPFKGKAFNHPRMWAQYGENHKGVCLIFDLESISKKVQSLEQIKVIQDRVIYSEKYLMELLDEEDPYWINTEQLEQLGIEKYYLKHVMANKRIYYFRKHLDWKDESEYRIVLINDSENERLIDIGDCLKALIIGSKTPKPYFESLSSLCDAFDISLFQMNWKNGFADSPKLIRENN